jgi:hypothetical protein
MINKLGIRNYVKERGCGLSEVMSRNFLEELKKTTEISTRRAYVGTENLSSTCPGCYCHMGLLFLDVALLFLANSIVPIAEV